MSLFAPALIKMHRLGSEIFGPLSFQAYLKETDQQVFDTARCISIQSYGDLAPELRNAGTMVFRLGCSIGDRNTQFALAKYVDGWGDYFFEDKELFGTLSPILFDSSPNDHQLSAFRYFPKYTETSLVNLALASGVLSHALQLDRGNPPSFPATGRGTYSFSFRPHARMRKALTHNRGQVEIDAAFVGRRAGRDVMFVVEAKASSGLGSLAKHKIAYPLLALRRKARRQLPLVGVYLRAFRRADKWHFLVAECDFRGDLEAIASLRAKGLGHYVLSGYSAKS